jgi:cytochrome b
MNTQNLTKVWDPVTRIWHWLLVLAVSAGWYMGEFMSFETVMWHFYMGYTIIGLLLFRLVWGLFGPKPIRWCTMFASLFHLKTYLSTVARREPSGVKGHNPMGALSVLFMICVLTGQVTTGLFIESEDFFETGPLYYLADSSTIDALTWWHHFLAKVLLATVVLHLSALAFYLLWKRENLIRPMITGFKYVKKDSSN